MGYHKPTGNTAETADSRQIVYPYGINNAVISSEYMTMTLADDETKTITFSSTSKISGDTDKIADLFTSRSHTDIKVQTIELTVSDDEKNYSGKITVQCLVQKIYLDKNVEYFKQNDQLGSFTPNGSYDIKILSLADADNKLQEDDGYYYNYDGSGHTPYPEIEKDDGTKISAIRMTHTVNGTVKYDYDFTVTEYDVAYSLSSGSGTILSPKEVNTNNSYYQLIVKGNNT